MRQVGKTLVLALVVLALASCDEDAKKLRLYAGPCEQENDNNADGVIDLRITYTYEGELLVLRETDAEPQPLDGVVDGLSHYFYDGDLLQRKEVDYGADGVSDQYYYFYYEGDDLLASVEIKEEPSGPNVGWYEFVYDERGNNIESYFNWLTVEDTVAQDIEYYTYDADDNMTVEEYLYDAHEGLEVDERFYNLFDGNGLKLRTDLDADGNEVIDGAIYYTYDSDDLLIMEETDSDLDQMIDEIDTYEYDSAGNMTRFTGDQGADGVDEIQYFSYGCW
jgi:hypothetical protein